MEEKVFKRQVAKLATSMRVIDEFQADRHFEEGDLSDLYNVTNISPAHEPQIKVLDDEILNEQLKKNTNIIYNVELHESLLKHDSVDTLQADEIREAWVEFEKEKSKEKMKIYMQNNIKKRAQHQPNECLTFEIGREFELVHFYVTYFNCC